MRIVKLFDLPPIEGMNDDNCGPKVSCSHLVVACQFLRSGSVVKRTCTRPQSHERQPLYALQEIVIEHCGMDVSFIVLPSTTSNDQVSIVCLAH